MKRGTMSRAGYHPRRLYGTRASITGLDRTEFHSRKCKFVREFTTLVGARTRTPWHLGENSCTSANMKRRPHQLQLVFHFPFARCWPVEASDSLTTFAQQATGLFCDCVRNRFQSDAMYMNAHSATGDTKVRSEEHSLVEQKWVYSFAVLVMKHIHIALAVWHS